MGPRLVACWLEQAVADAGLDHAPRRHLHLRPRERALRVLPHLRGHIPSPESGAQWDSDGLPKYIEVALREWKTRTTCHMGKKYKMRLWRNYLDPRFCPVTWLVTWLHYSDIRNCPLFQSFEGGRPSGTHMSTTQWTGATGRLFTAAGLYEPGHYTEGVEEEMGEWVPAAGVTNHGIRRSVCQWASRCGADSLDVSTGHATRR